MARGKTAEERSGESVDVTGRVYHTVEGVAHLEGETYALTNLHMAENLYGMGWVTIEGWTPPVEPPLRGALVGPDDDRDPRR